MLFILLYSLCVWLFECVWVCACVCEPLCAFLFLFGHKIFDEMFCAHFIYILIHIFIYTHSTYGTYVWIYIHTSMSISWCVLKNFKNEQSTRRWMWMDPHTSYYIYSLRASVWVTVRHMHVYIGRTRDGHPT